MGILLSERIISTNLVYMLAFMGVLNEIFIANFFLSRVIDDHVFCVDDIFKTTEPLAIQLGMVVHHHSECH